MGGLIGTGVGVGVRLHLGGLVGWLVGTGEGVFLNKY